MSDFTDWLTTPRNYAIFRKKSQIKRSPSGLTYAEDPEHVDLPGYPLREQIEKIMPDFDLYDAVLRDEVENGPVTVEAGEEGGHATSEPKVSEESEDSNQLEQSDLSDEDTSDLSSAKESGKRSIQMITCIRFKLDSSSDSSDDDEPQSNKRKIEQLDTFRDGLMQWVESNKDHITPAMVAKFERIGVNFENKMRMINSKEQSLILNLLESVG
ncbi:hypothetical protein BGZ82_005692 [Podila clonocystis]|nr:hypothetical protein BGZ82_005692 [Podila clonocystis]